MQLDINIMCLFESSGKANGWTCPILDTSTHNFVEFSEII